MHFFHKGTLCRTIQREALAESNVQMGAARTMMLTTIVTKVAQASLVIVSPQVTSPSDTELDLHNLTLFYNFISVVFCLQTNTQFYINGMCNVIRIHIVISRYHNQLASCYNHKST